jgi:hypothetical protein
MARQRIIHPEFWSSEDIIPLSPIARLLFVGIWSFADDDGRIPFKVIPLKCQIFPMDNIDVTPLVQELLSVGVVTEYSYEGDKYLVVKSWHKHQTIKYPTYKHPTSEGNIKAYDRIKKIHSVKKFGDKSPTSTEHVKNMSRTSTEQVPNMSPTCEEHVPPKLNKTKLNKTKLNKEIESVGSLEVYEDLKNDTHAQSEVSFVLGYPSSSQDVVDHGYINCGKFKPFPERCIEFYELWQSCDWADSNGKNINWKQKLTYFLRDYDQNKPQQKKNKEQNWGLGA